MLISGFTFVRNAEKYYFPVKESIESILPVVDEFVIALGESDEGDHTEEIIRSINSPKIRIIHRKWDAELYKNGEIFRHETNFALSQCKGEWCFYIQADEVVHEDDLPIIKKACEEYLNKKETEGLLFNYLHFWGDYDHYLPYHGWYQNEMRIVRNNIGADSIKDAQSFRKTNGEKLKVKPINARIFHYGWVRPPQIMRSKKKEQDSFYWGLKKAKEHYSKVAPVFDYGPLGKIPVYKGTHPKVMKERIKQLFWKDQLNYGNILEVERPLFKHEQLKYRALTFIERNILGGRQIGGYKNWVKL